MNNKQIADYATAGIDGHVLVKDYETGEILLDKHNAINYVNMAVALASLLANELEEESNATWNITNIAYGNGASTVDVSGSVAYKTPDVQTTTGELYNETYRKSVADVDSENKIDVVKYAGKTFADVVITSTLDYAEPADADTLDQASDFADDYIFDELGLVTDSGHFLTHIVFHPIQKSMNRKIQVIYTLRISAGS